MTLDPHETTLASYDAGVAAYLAADGPGVSDAAGALVERLPAGARVLEIGSGGGRDARHLRAHGLDVQVSDASAGFRQHLRTLGFEPIAYDLLADPVPSGQWSGLLANAVLLHVPRAELSGVLQRLRAAVAPGVAFSLSLKTGREDGWSSAKLDAPRWFTYWSEGDIRAELQGAGWRVESCEASTGRRDDWLTILAVAA